MIRLCPTLSHARLVSFLTAARVKLAKPDPAIYTPVLAMLGTTPAETLAVGDSLRTDIAGAKSRDIPSCWVLGGIHETELGGNPARIKAAATNAGLKPTAVLTQFIW